MASSKLNFEVNLNGAFKVFESGYAVLTELPEVGAPDIFPPLGPFDPTPSNMIAQTDQPLLVKFRWRVRGGLALIMSGKWECAVYLEEMGAGEFGGPPFSTSTPFMAVLDHTYDVTVNIPANSIPKGLYKVTVAVSLMGPAPTNAALPVVAFADIGILKTYVAA